MTLVDSDGDVNVAIAIKVGRSEAPGPIAFGKGVSSVRGDIVEGKCTYRSHDKNDVPNILV